MGAATPKALDAPTLYLAIRPGAQGDNCLAGSRGVQQMADAPALLVSYVYLDRFLGKRDAYRFRHWVMDSGAFTAHLSGEPIRLADYIDAAKRLADDPAGPKEVFGLDVIGDWRASQRNTRTMVKKGIDAIPTYHGGEPWSVLVGLARDYPKVAIGGVARWPIARRLAFLDQVFARVWPARLHGFGMATESVVMRFPFESIDSTTWNIAPCRFGRWEAFGKTVLGIRGSKHDLTAEVEHYLRMERKARSRWAKEMKLLRRSA